MEGPGGQEAQALWGAAGVRELFGTSVAAQAAGLPASHGPCLGFLGFSCRSGCEVWVWRREACAWAAPDSWPSEGKVCVLEGKRVQWRFLEKKWLFSGVWGVWVVSKGLWAQAGSGGIICGP